MKKTLSLLLTVLLCIGLVLPGLARAADASVDVLCEGTLEADAFLALTGLSIDRVGALADLLTGAALNVKYSEAGGEARLLVNGQPVLTLTGDRDDQGGLTVASPLFPSYALALPAEALQGAPNAGLSEMITFLLGADAGETYVEDAYSSLFSQALFRELSSHTVAGWLLALSRNPLADALLREWMNNDITPAQFAQSALDAPAESWGMVAKYKADEKQYPDLRLVRVELDIPALPHLYLWVRVDEFGASVRFACEEADVADWDETIKALSEGKSAGGRGFLLDVFTLNFDDDAEKNTYIEAALTLPGGARLVAEIDYYASLTGAYAWEVDCLLREDTLGDMGTLHARADYSAEAAPAAIDDLAARSLLSWPFTADALDSLLADIRDIGLPALREQLLRAAPAAAGLMDAE